jgi:hypothetical protein
MRASLSGKLAGVPHRSTSVDKLRAVLELCAVHRVRCSPLWLRDPPRARAKMGQGLQNVAPVNGIVIVPLMSWYHCSWDTEPDVLSEPPADLTVASDHFYCRWPDELDDTVQQCKVSSNAHARAQTCVDHGRLLAEWFASLNEPALSQLTSTLPGMIGHAGRTPPKQRLTEAQTWKLLNETTKPGGAAREVPASAATTGQWRSLSLDEIREIQQEMMADDVPIDFEQSEPLSFGPRGLLQSQFASSIFQCRRTVG